jgi:hypothetical protein
MRVTWESTNERAEAITRCAGMSTAADNREPGNGREDGFVYVFNHVNRTAGASVGQVLARWFRPVWDYQAGPDPASRERWLSHPLQLRDLPAGSVVMGHYTGDGGRLRERYPEVFSSRRYRVITVLRNPWHLALSHARRIVEETGGAKPIAEAVLEIAGIFSKNLGRDGRAFPRLNDYWFVGTTENLPACFDALADRLNQARVIVPHTNAARAPIDLDPGLPAEFRDRTRADSLLHRRACRAAHGILQAEG